jgi:hypothetical protein
MSWDQCQPIGIEILNTCIKLKHYPSNSGLPCLFLARALALAHVRLQSAQTFAPTQPCRIVWIPSDDVIKLLPAYLSMS